MFSIVPRKKKLTRVAVPEGGPVTGSSSFPAILKRMRNEFDELFGRFYGELPFSVPGTPGAWPWELTALDKPNEIIVKAEAPGFEVGDFEVLVRGNELILHAAKKTESKEEGKYNEVRERKCYESVTLPAGVNAEKVEAKYHNGVLTITIPKTEEGKGRKVVINSA
jgi:HSP20 family protein